MSEYLNLIIQQYYNKPKAMAEIGLYSDEFEKVFNILNDFVNKFDLDKATGDRLDKIGKIVGFGRIVENAIPKVYFGFNDNVESKSFGEAPFFDIVTDSGLSPTELDDNQYKFYLTAKIAKNISKAVMIDDEGFSVQDAVSFLFNGNAFVLDNQNMTLTIYVDSQFNENDIKFLKELDLLPKPQAVGYKFIISFNSENSFGFSDNPNSKSFGVGKFAQLII